VYTKAVAVKTLVVLYQPIPGPNIALGQPGRKTARGQGETSRRGDGEITGKGEGEKERYVPLSPLPRCKDSPDFLE
jgi:hypothetical protein